MKIFKGEFYRISVLTDKLVRLEYSRTGNFEDRTTQLIYNRDFGQVSLDYIETSNVLDIMTDYFHLHFNKGEFNAENLFIELKGNFAVYGSRWYFGESIETLKGTARTLDKADGAISLEDGIISRNGIALLDDSQGFIWDEQSGYIERENQIDLYFFAYGHDYRGAIRDFYHLTGSTPLLPRYALGNWWSRYWPYTSDEYLDLIDRFETEKIPLSIGVLDMDWHITDIPARFGSGWTGYSWNRNLIPNPEQLLQQLHDRKLKLSLNVHPADGIRAYEEAYPQIAKRLGLNVELEEPAIFDFFNPSFREAYFKDVHYELEKQGVDFWWIDWQQGTQGMLDPLWLLNHYHYQDSCKNAEGGLILSRYAGPGSHRYPVGFSGDTIISWNSLRFQPYFTATASNIGYSWWSHDIGGHMLGDYDEELQTRWLQFGVFSPITRLHSSRSPFNSKEPWFFSEKKYTGGVKLSVYRDISTTPVFAKSGAIIPLVGSEIGMGVDLPEVVDWYVFPGKQHSFEMLEDQNGQRYKTRLSIDWEMGMVELALQGDSSIVPSNRKHRIHFKGTNVSIIELPNKNDTAKFEWKDNKRTSLNDEVFRLLKTASLPYELKDRLLNQFINAKNSHDLMNILHHQDKELRGRLLEMIFTSQN
ncbi:glycoside hydrolase family 31 protein [Streptococcus pneumoniae]|nr:glycoside hydrolase family 31 protein [Streptococcus pneumoniae]MDS5582646.1 glycoside hydrolase family 31 protein [Streptococcus pneumoniae]MDT5737910.1 glycoside hydrolase family 31 protein [Streptococcus pneumoniae]VJU77977.1 glycosyl hydrolase, family 31 [Streptococcus pneumoniae]VNO64686.1 glycosyl hydrolase, family 31 [Streptococcus pneumoniae]